MLRRSLLLVAALASTAGAGEVEASQDRYAPKGRVPMPGVQASPHADPVAFLYAAYIQQQLGTNRAGAGALMKQGDPGLAAGDSHTLGEIGVLSADGRQIVEIGWHVDPLVNDDLQPRLFIFHWVDGQPTCYNGGGFVQVSTTMKPGMRVSAGATAEYAIELRGTDWWLSYQGEDLGYFPGSLWPTPYTAAGYVQWFGEIAAASASSCSEMGNGAFGNDPMASSMHDLFLFAAGGARVPANARTGTVTNPAQWSVGQTTPTSFSFGGPGQRGGGCCTPNTCADAMAECGSVPDRCGAPLACGACDGFAPCSPTLTCGAAPLPGEALDPTDEFEESGCCQTGQGAMTAWVAALGVLLVLRRRRRPSR
ncbi:MAG: neprosin family prolyl endopeptidase [Kofleriaceae bacterium]|nr:neprosin family prolyl endopeptidase [Kofleriaceae bacterium]